MNDDALKKLWQEQPFGLAPVLPDAEQIALMKRKMKGFDKKIFRRDFVEVAAGLLIVVWFGKELFKAASLEELIGCSLLILSSIFIDCKLILSKRRVPVTDPSAPVEEAIKTEIRKVEIQIRLLRSVWWWYLLPLLVGVNLVFSGCNPSLAASLGYACVVLLLYFFIYWLNQRAVKRNLLPMKAELEALLGSPPNTTAMKPTMKMTMLMLLSAICASAGPVIWAAIPSITNAFSGPLPADTAQALEVIRKKYDFPALAVVVVKDGKICDRAAVGVRKSGDPTLVTTNDQFHIGSCTKSMTATLAAMFIEEGRLRWDTAIGEVFPELKGKMDHRYEAVTVEQLLTHRGGVPGKPPSAAWKQAWKQEGTPMDQRREFMAAVLAAPQEDDLFKPGLHHRGLHVGEARGQTVGGPDHGKTLQTVAHGFRGIRLPRNPGEGGSAVGTYQ
jgi:hypothetical protein